MVEYSDQKVRLAHELYNCIDEPTEELDRELAAQENIQNGNNETLHKGKQKRGQK